MIGRLSLTGIAIGLLACPAYAQDQQADVTQDVLACREIARDGPRLKCFDKVLDDAFGKSEEIEERREATFGLPETISDADEAELTGTISEVREELRYGITIIALDNGQVWQTTSTGTMRGGFSVGKKVTIRPGTMGGFRLYLEGKNGFRGVKRVR